MLHREMKVGLKAEKKRDVKNAHKHPRSNMTKHTEAALLEY